MLDYLVHSALSTLPLPTQAPTLTLPWPYLWPSPSGLLLENPGSGQPHQLPFLAQQGRGTERPAKGAADGPHPSPSGQPLSHPFHLILDHLSSFFQFSQVWALV